MGWISLSSAAAAAVAALVFAGGSALVVVGVLRFRDERRSDRPSGLYALLACASSLVCSLAVAAGTAAILTA